MTYQSISNYGIIGDMRSAALVSVAGSIDWLCLPRFDSPSVFAALLDDKKGGFFQIGPVDTEKSKYKQFYWPDTNVLVTRFLQDMAAAELVDFMPVGEETKFTAKRRQLIRRVTAVRGQMKLRMECRPAFNYARDHHETAVGQQGAEFRSSSTTLGLATSMPLKIEQAGVVCEFTLNAGETAVFVLHEMAEDEECASFLSEAEVEEEFRQTVTYWRNWLSKSTYKGRWREIVDRSALALKLLTYEPTGAIVAAPTCSLPEGIGGERNWDYRYTWMRDSAFTVFSLLRLGFTEEAENFVKFISGVCAQPNPDGSLQIMYGIDGRRKLVEEELDHLDGYKGSRPVRVGNGAYNQLQLDIYGELLDAMYLFNKYAQPLDYGTWKTIARLVDWVCDNWQRKDEGIWEVRGGQQEFIYSKLMCWVAIDRALKIADARSFPADRLRWAQVRDVIYEEIMDRGWSEKVGAFVQHYDSDTLDAANLMMILTFFLSPADQRTIRMLDAILLPPAKGGLVSNSLVYRYNVEHTRDGLRGSEGTFNICTFWLVDALAHAGRFDRRRVEEARLIFERMLGFANHLGLYAEETGPSGEGLGNFPQAFTHLSLITAALNLDRVIDEIE
ncbi:MAG: glycoside hydrolase family 15 protein [Hyphomicrobiaceae bacterium]